MLLKKLNSLILILITFLLTACGSQPSAPSGLSDVFLAGKDYQLVVSMPDTPLPPPGKIQVIEFFSYACPACLNFEPYLEEWLKDKPQDVVFERIPVVFEQNWDVLAKAFYTVQTLGIAEKLAPLIFNAIQIQGQDLTNPILLKQFFVAHGVKPEQFDSIFNFSPGMDAQLTRADQLMKGYQIYEIPTLIVAGRYKTSPAMAGSGDRMIKVLDFLIQESRPKNSETNG